MKQNKNLFTYFVLALAALIPAASARALTSVADPDSASQLSGENIPQSAEESHLDDLSEGSSSDPTALYTSISQNCASIKQSLVSLQRADSRTRSYLGSDYETILRSFINPLSTRLVKNNYDAAEIFTIQANFIAEQTTFRNNYTAYMRELENLIHQDCFAQPESFYEQLIRTRTFREDLQKSTTKLSALISDQYSAVKKFQERLK